MRGFYFIVITNLLFVGKMLDKSASEVVKGGIDVKLRIEALLSEMRKMLKEEMDQLHEMVE